MKQTKYFALHKRDTGEEKDDPGRRKELYGRLKGFDDLDEALKFVTPVFPVLNKEHETRILVKREAYSVEGSEIPKDKREPYVIAAFFRGKYHHYFAGTTEIGSDWPTYEVRRCAPNKLEETLRKVTRGNPDRVYWGIELKIMPKVMPSENMFNKRSTT